MEMITLGLIGLVSLIIAIQDFKTRSIHLFVLLAYLGLFPVFGLYIRKPDLIDIGLNLGFLIAVLSITWLVSILVFKRKIFEIIGLGDVLYLLISVLYFRFPDYLIWFNIGLMFSLIVHFFVSGFNHKHSDSKQLIPLAGYLAIIFTFAIAFENYVGSINSIIYHP